MKVVSVAQMQAVEKEMISSCINERELMRLAGKSVVAELNDLLDLSEFKEILVICGKGNNGGDGYVIAQCLSQINLPVKVLATSKYENLSDQAFYFASKLNSQILLTTGFNLPKIDKDTLIIDALFGTGFSGSLSYEYIDLINQINNNVATVVSVDIPSGLNGDSGVAQPIAVQADYTVTIGLPKLGLFFNNALESVGGIALAKLPISEEIYENIICDYEAFFESDSKFLMRRRRRNTHKKSYGSVNVIGGSKNYQGAPVLSALGAMRSGCGYVTLATIEKLNLLTTPFSLLKCMLPDGNLGFIGTAALEVINPLIGESTVTIFGPGIARFHDTTLVLKEVIKNARALVIDADGLWHLTRIKNFQEFSIPTILTPHPGEMALLVETFLPNMKAENRFDQALELAERLNAYVVLKGKFTFVASPQYDSYIITSGSESLATAGSGDVLAGIIGAFFAEALTSAESVIDAINSAVFIHGKAGEIAPSSRAMIADDLPQLLMQILK